MRKLPMAGFVLIAVMAYYLRLILASLQNSPYIQPHFSNPLMQFGGCLCFVYVVWFLFGPFAKMAQEPYLTDEQLATVESISSRQAMVALGASLLFLAAFVWVMLQVSWLLNQRYYH
jgi:hypothetical protein